MSNDYKDVSLELMAEEIPAKKITEHFSKPMKEGSSLIVDEAMALQYADVCKDLKELEKVKNTLKDLLMSSRMQGEKVLQIGKAIVEYTEVKDQIGVDYEAMYVAMNGEPSEADKKKYRKVLRKGYSYPEVKKVT